MLIINYSLEIQSSVAYLLNARDSVYFKFHRQTPAARKSLLKNLKAAVRMPSLLLMMFSTSAI